MGVSASAHRVSCAHDPLKPHPVRQDVHSAQEMTLIDCTLFTERRGGRRRVKTRQFARWVCEAGVAHLLAGGTCVCVRSDASTYWKRASMCISTACFVPFVSEIAKKR